uniref:RNA exonuclease 4 n=2 Tax=Pipistrellus kuhlii TaxID=59472 RepID=A0A7J7RM94_PIPKU|nr:RNA exonuclease 4 [Pipistrellus kuhlii]KAF6277223.1 REX4-like protein, 3'-5' exonuclease [Pipistrellus kuhlii]
MARAPGLTPAAQPGLAGKLPREKKKKKKRFWKNKAREASRKPGGDPAAALRPPRAPEAFSQNWKALQEVLKQKSQAPGKPLVLSPRDSKKQPQVAQQDGKAEHQEVGMEQAGREAPTGSVPPASLPNGRAPGPPKKARGAERTEKAPKRTNGDISPKRGDLKHKKRKAKEVTAALTPAPPTEPDIWFDDVDPVDIEAAMGPEAAEIARRQLGAGGSSAALEKEQAFGGLTRALALDCEMVGVGPAGEESLAARVSVVNQFGKCVYDKYIRPTQPVTDYRTAVSGIRPEHLQQGEAFAVVQKEVAEMLRGRILVGHSLHNDLKVLFLDHPRKKVRDTQKYKPFQQQVQSGRPSLKLLAERILGVRVQQAEHCSIQDAQAAMRLYVTVKKEWERAVQDRRPAPAAAPDDA